MTAIEQAINCSTNGNVKKQPLLFVSTVTLENMFTGSSCVTIMIHLVQATSEEERVVQLTVLEAGSLRLGSPIGSGEVFTAKSVTAVVAEWKKKMAS